MTTRIEALEKLALADLEFSEQMIPSCKIPIQEKATAALALIASHRELLAVMKWVTNHGGLGYSIHNALNQAIKDAEAL